MKSLFYKPKRAAPKQKYSIIKYFSDLFIMLMVVSWIVVDAIMVAMAIYSTIRFQDTSIWGHVESLTAVPLTAGGAIWMVKNAVQHAIMNSKGQECPSDFHCDDPEHCTNPSHHHEMFAKVDADGDGEVIEQEIPMINYDETEAQG
ncbi:MAG: hypothetical protein NC548_19925 [Lachnospiraceae bacterium]|nr:hypothetical protein [Lachnospiraceae bacterium]